jgi:peptidoglycan/xylan/chitin deacetylase (PgdA/CDA1 family)
MMKTSPAVGKMIKTGAASALIIAVFMMFAPPSRADNVALCYHKFSYALEDLYSVLPEVFQWQIEYVKNKKIPFIRIGDLVNAYSGRAALDESVLVTIDDGWKSQLNILPVIEKENVPVTLYLYPLVIHPGVREYFNPDDIEMLVKNPLIDYGCHSYSHTPMMKMSQKKLFREVIWSRQVLEKMLGRKLFTFAYPYGMFDHASKDFTRRFYKLILGVNDGSNSAKSNQANLNRYIVYKNTTFGEFADMIEHVKGRSYRKPYSVIRLGEETDYDKYFEYTKVRLYKWPVERKARTVLVIPGSTIGAGWIYKTGSAILKTGAQVYVMVNRNNNIPFYRQDDIIKVVKDWGIEPFRQDLRLALDYVTKSSSDVVIMTWGDGFDLLMSILCEGDKYRHSIKGIITINPSLAGNDGSAAWAGKGFDHYGSMEAAGKYEAEDLNFFLKVKTLADMMVLNPDGMSQFGARLGYPYITNKDLLAKVLNSANHPEWAIDYNSPHYTLDNFREAFMQPVPLFSMVLPVPFLRDIYGLWYNGDFSAAKTQGIDYPAAFLYTSRYEANIKAVRNAFPGLKVAAETEFDGLSTIELMLSDNASINIAGLAVGMLK